MADVDAHWRDSARRPKFYFMDALGFFPLLIAFLHMRTWTFTMAAIVVLFFALLERFKFTLPILRRFVLSFLAGPLRISHPWWRH